MVHGSQLGSPGDEQPTAIDVEHRVVVGQDGLQVSAGGQLQSRPYHQSIGGTNVGEVDPVSEVGAQAEGCSIIQATASMMSEELKGKNLEALDDLAREFRELMRSKSSQDQAPPDLGALGALMVVRQFPVRIKCALLPWTALEVGIKAYRSSQTRDQ